MSLVDTTQINALTRFLDATAQRQQAITTNIANIDTPGYGQQRMALRNILQLASGSVIELDRQAEDPVDLLLDERLIARGQVVVVDGCYGLRVTEVCR
jgi:flagellar motor switch protein FliN